MTPTNFFRGALGAPLVLPLLLAPFGHGPVQAVLLMSLMLGGVQYLVFGMAVLTFALRDERPTAQLKRGAWWLPLAYVPVQAAGWLLFAAVAPGMEMGAEVGWGALTMAAYALGLGYAYVVLTLLVYALASRLGWVRERAVA